MNTTRLLTGLTFITVMMSSIAFAADTLNVIMQEGKQRVEFSLHGKTGCVLVDSRVFCAPASTRAPIRMASSATD